jgi:hypothetical protein
VATLWRYARLILSKSRRVAASEVWPMRPLSQPTTRSIRLGLSGHVHAPTPEDRRSGLGPDPSSRHRVDGFLHRAFRPADQTVLTCCLRALRRETNLLTGRANDRLRPPREPPSLHLRGGPRARRAHEDARPDGPDRAQPVTGKGPDAGAIILGLADGDQIGDRFTDEEGE